MHRFVLKTVCLCLTTALLLGLAGCSSSKPQDSAAPAAPAQEDKLILGAYTVPKEAYEKEIIPAFQAYWKEKTGRTVTFDQSYVGSGAQARAICAGFEADIAALSLEADVDQIVKAGLITHDWKSNAWRGFITDSVVVIGYRPGNPRGIEDWEDVTGPDIDVLCPNPKTSGGAQWFINALVGAGMKKSEVEKGAKDSAAGRDLLVRVMKRVKVMDKSGRESVTTFERGIGDAILTYENEALLRTMQGREFPFAIPKATILIENPVALVDKHVDKHGVRAVAEEFVKFLYTEDCQRSFAKYGFRPVLSQIAEEFQEKYPVPPFLFTVEYLGGWSEIERNIFSETGIWNEVSRKMTATESAPEPAAK